MSDSYESPVVFLDFDGTISRADVVDVLLERFAEPGWQRLEEEWRDGRIGSRACLSGQLALVRASEADVLSAIDAIEIDPGFPALIDLLAARRLGAYILSDGFDFCIERLLARVPGASEVFGGRVYASHLEPAEGGRWRTAFPHFDRPCEHGCATCKPGLIAALNPAGAPTIFVGDGLSDRHAARAADVVFAKAALAMHCGREHISFIPYRSLAEVAAVIEDGILTGRDGRASGAGAA